MWKRYRHLECDANWLVCLTRIDTSTVEGICRYSGSTVGQRCCRTSPLPKNAGLIGFLTWDNPESKRKRKRERERLVYYKEAAIIIIIIILFIFSFFSFYKVFTLHLYYTVILTNSKNTNVLWIIKGYYCCLFWSILGCWERHCKEKEFHAIELVWKTVLIECEWEHSVLMYVAGDWIYTEKHRGQLARPSLLGHGKISSLSMTHTIPPGRMCVSAKHCPSVFTWDYMLENGARIT